MILCVGLSPAWQRHMYFDDFEMDEVNRATGGKLFSSGKALNAVITAHCLGAPCLGLTFCGGLQGEAMREDMNRRGIAFEGVETEAQTRCCTTLINRATGEVTELVESAPPVKPQELETLRQAILAHSDRSTIAVLSGSMPLGAPPETFHKLVDKTGLDIVADIRGPELLKLLPLRPLIVKPNQEELAKTLGTPTDSEDALKGAMQSLATRGARWVVISQGAGAVLVYGEGTFHRLRPPRIESVNPIGAGDAFAAGIAVACSRGLEVLEAVRFGMAAAVDKVCRLYQWESTPESVSSRVTDIDVERL